MRFAGFKPKNHPIDTIILDTETGPVSVKQRINYRAKKLILRIDIKTGEPVVTVPKGISQKQVVQFVTQHQSWILEQYTKTLQSHIGDGDIALFQGQQYRLIYTDTPPRMITLTGQSHEKTISVGGPEDQAGKRLEKWLKQEARIKLIKACDHYSKLLGVEYNKISIGDMKSRWGSCSSQKILRFNWRLIMAPPQILHYVAAHEVCHLLEMNHSDRFWSHVNSCMPDYYSHRKWLRTSGQNLMSVKFLT